MKKAISILPLFCFSLAFGQNVQGTWKWKNEKYEGIARVDSNKFFNEIYFLNSGTKVLEQFHYYHLDKNKIYLSERPWNEDPDKKGKTVYKIKDSDAKKMVLSGISEDVYQLVSQEIPEVVPLKNDNFYTVSGKPVCISGGTESNAIKCLKFGEIDFSLSLEDIQKKMGNANSTKYNEDHSVTYLFLIYPTEKNSPVLQVTIKDSKINCLELTGYKNKDDFAFSSIRLGDFDTFVKQRLGEPYLKKEVTAPGDETWLYAQVPVTIQFRRHKITSIKIEPL